MSEFVLENNFDSYFQLAKTRLSEGSIPSDILKEMRSLGASDEMLETLLKKLLIIKNMKLGFTLLLIGSACCLCSCLLTLGSSFESPFYHSILYGLTSIGAGLVIYGLYLIMG